MNIQYGNREGQYFTEWRFELLAELVGLVSQNFEHLPKYELEDIKIWYDNAEDYHRLSFKFQEHVVEVRFYKVFACVIDGKEGWVGCLRNEIYNYARYLRKEITTPAKKLSEDL